MTFDYIQGNRFKSLTKWHFAPLYGAGGRVKNVFAETDYRYLKNTFTNDFPEGGVVYTHTFFADYFFATNKKECILITHNCDTAADIIPPDNILMWYTTNVNIEHERVKSIPIGIENDIWLKDKNSKMMNKIKQKKKYRNLLYMNHNIKTNPAKRQRPYDVFQGLSWVTTNIGANGQGFDNYLDNIYHHPFVVCPEGNGIDTHRVWECLYVGTIPVMIRNTNNQFYTDLPILFIDDWEEITERFLHDKFGEIIDTKWNSEKLWFNYWRNYVASAGT